MIIMPKQQLPVFSIPAVRECNDKYAELVASRLKEYLAKRPYLFQPHRHSFYHLVYLTAGQGKHTLDFVNYGVNAGQIYFMVPGQAHSWNFTGEVDGYVINFTENFFNDFLKYNSYPEQFPFFTGDTEEQIIQLSKERQKVVTGLFEKIIAEQEQNTDAYAIDIIRTLLLQLFIIVNRQIELTQKKYGLRPNHLVLRNFRKLVEENYRHIKLPGEYAARLHVTPNYLNALCKELLGKTAGEILRERIVLEVKRLLVNTEMTVGEIANHLNFEDRSNFTKFFKRYTGITPEEFREKQQRIYIKHNKN